MPLCSTQILFSLHLKETLLPWRWRQNVSWKRNNISTRVRRVPYRNTPIFTECSIHSQRLLATDRTGGVLRKGKLAGVRTYPHRHLLPRSWMHGAVFPLHHINFFFFTAWSWNTHRGICLSRYNTKSHIVSWFELIFSPYVSGSAVSTTSHNNNERQKQCLRVLLLRKAADTDSRSDCSELGRHHVPGTTFTFVYEYQLQFDVVCTVHHPTICI